MADIQRKAEATWTGDIRSGSGVISSQSNTLSDTPYSFVSRFESGSGTNPEELIASAHAACYSMALTSLLGSKGHKPTSIHTHAVCSLTPQQSGFKLTKMHLETRGDVPGMDDATFKQMAEDAEKICPVSNALRGGLEITLDAALKS